MAAKAAEAAKAEADAKAKAVPQGTAKRMPPQGWHASGEAAR